MTDDEGREAARARVAAEMATLGWNVADLARAARIDLGTAGDFINGARWPRRATQNKIEDALSWSPGSLALYERGQTQPAGLEPEDVSAPLQDVDALGSLAPEAVDGMEPAELAEILAATKLSAYQTAREIRRRRNE